MSNKQESQNSQEKISVYPSKKTLFLLLGGAILMLFFSVWLFTRPSFISAFDLTNKGTIGDAINGITGPIIALISAGLLFYSFQAQLEANRRQLDANKMLKAQWEFDTYYRLYGEIQKAFLEDLKVTLVRKTTKNGVTTEERTPLRATGYIKYITEKIPKADEKNLINSLIRLEAILEDMIALINYVRTSDVSQKAFFLHRINRFYMTSLEKYLSELYHRLPQKPAFQKSHDLHELLKQTFASIRHDELKQNILLNSIK